MRITGRAAARWAAICILGLIGMLMLVVTPGMLILGAWGGSDVGSVPEGIAFLFVLPWALYLASTAGAVFLLSRRRPVSAFVIGLCQLASVIWVGRSFIQ